jgi:DNA-binding transcriptional ArsR family regulator
MTKGSWAVDFLHHWQWLIAAVIAAIPAIYHAPKKALETWDWYLNRFRDRVVLDVLREVRIPKKLAPFNPTGPGQISPTIVSIAKEGSYGVGDLADILNRSQRSIGKSLRRLKAQGKVELDRGGFKIRK